LSHLTDYVNPERAPAKSGALFFGVFSLVKNNSELAGSPKIKMGEAIGFLLFVVHARFNAPRSPVCRAFSSVQE